MSYSEARKIHDLRVFHHDWGSGGRVEVLRLVLAIALDHETAAWCLGRPREAAVMRWPSTLYRVLARSAYGSPRIWTRCALVLDRTLHEAIGSYAARPAAELAEAFLEGRESLTGDDLGALLWCLIRRRCPTHDLVAERLSHELEVVAAQRLGGAGLS